MELLLTGHHVHVSDSLRQFTERKFKRIERHFDNITRVHVTLVSDQKSKRAEATLQVGRHRIFAEGKAANLRTAIDLLVDRIDRQVIKQKERMQDHRVPHGTNGTS